MTNAELQELLADFGDHLPVVIAHERIATHYYTLGEIDTFHGYLVIEIAEETELDG